MKNTGVDRKLRQSLTIENLGTGHGRYGAKRMITKHRQTDGRPMAIERYT